MSTAQANYFETMDRDEVWRVIDAQRLSLAGVLEHLTDEEWRQPSLCEDWTVRDVAAHLTMQQMRFSAAVIEMIRWPGSLNRMIHNAA